MSELRRQLEQLSARGPRADVDVVIASAIESAAASGHAGGHRASAAGGSDMDPIDDAAPAPLHRGNDGHRRAMVRRLVAAAAVVLLIGAVAVVTTRDDGTSTVITATPIPDVDETAAPEPPLPTAPPSTTAPSQPTTPPDTESEQPGSADPDPVSGIESATTTIEFDRCEVIERFPESGGSTRRCDGLGDTALYIGEGDGRFDVDAGVPDDVFLTSGRAFNSLGDTVEWRLRDGEPFAVIVRFDFDDGFDVESSELAVIAIGTPASPGCLVEWVRADAAPDQATAARRIADERAADVTCSLDPGAPQLPDSVLGRFAADADDCLETVSPNEVVVTRERLDFYYGYADVRAVTRVDDRWHVEATLRQLEGALEVVPEPATYTLRPTANGIVFDVVGTEAPAERLIRCGDTGSG